jgi:putative flavoprotein involved in K+ transport
VLVVGLSHSGGDIALETAATHSTIVAGRFHGQLPVRVIDTPRARVLWPVIVFALGKVLTIRTPIGRRARSKVRTGGAPLLRVRLPDLAAAGVEHVDARVEGVRDGRPVLGDGRAFDVANVIWATGYRQDYDWIDLPVVGADGWPDEERGVSRTVPGLYFLGVPFSYAFTSMLVAGAGRDAAYVVDRIVAAGAEARSRAAAPASA